MYNKKDYDRRRYQRIRAERIANAPPDPISFLKPTERAYIAGIIDGEGAIYARNERKTIYPSISIVMTDEAVIMWMQDRVVGQKVQATSREQASRYKGPLKTQYVFRVCGKRAKLLCKSLLPYMITKKAHAEIVAKWPTDQRGEGLTQDVQDRRRDLGEKLTALNGYVYQRRHNPAFVRP